MKYLKFKDYDLTLKLTPFINIIGPSSSGKTTLLRTLINQTAVSNVEIDEKPVSDYDIDFLRKNIAAVLNNFQFKKEYVKEELLYYQTMINIPESEAYYNIENFTKFFGLEDIIESKIELLSTYEKAYIKILSLLIIKPTIFGIDDMLTYLTLAQKLKIIKFANGNNITIINVTSNPEELLLGTDIVLIDNHKAVLYEETNQVLSDDKILSKIGMSEPFIVELSSNLNYYDLLQKKYFDMKALVGELWK